MASPRCIALALVAAVGCGTARMVERTDRGGSLVLSGDRSQAKLDAHEKMSEHCGGAYTVGTEAEEPAAAGKAETRVSFVCGRIPGHPDSQYTPPDTSVGDVPNANSIGLE